jgi:hypothetical protein
MPLDIYLGYHEILNIILECSYLLWGQQHHKSSWAQSICDAVGPQAVKGNLTNYFLSSSWQKGSNLGLAHKQKMYCWANHIIKVVGRKAYVMLLGQRL